MILGLTSFDWFVIIAYLLIIIGIGLYSNRRVKSTGDYFMGGRKFGKLLMIGQAFGTGTQTSQVVAVSGGAARVGLAGIWFQWLYLFSTPFYWLLAPIYRRLRYLTIGDFFEKRYGMGMGATYAGVGLLYFAVTTGIMLKGAGVTIEAITGGAISTNAAVIAMAVFLLVYSSIGGLVAAVRTQTVQGLFILILSFLLIPFALMAAGGLEGVQARLPADRDWFSLVSTEEVTLFYIVMAVINGMVGITVQPHHMAINGAGKDEIACRTGWTYGNFIKRFATLGWAISGIFIASLFPMLAQAGRGERELAFGMAARQLLPSGLVGLLVAAVVAAVVAGASSFMVNGSALFTRNFYRRFLKRDATEAHYLAIGRLGSFFIVVVGVGISILLESVIAGLELGWRIMAFMGIAFWTAVVWRRANRYGAWSSLIVTAILSVWTTNLGWDFASQAALYLPVGFATIVIVSLLTKPEDERLLDEFYTLLRTPVGEEYRLKAAGIETIHEAELPEVVIPEEPPPSSAPIHDDTVAEKRGESLVLTNLLSLHKNFSWRRYRVDLTGFLVAWGIVGVLLLIAFGISAALS